MVYRDKGFFIRKTNKTKGDYKMKSILLKRKQQFLALLLTLVMVVGMLPLNEVSAGDYSAGASVVGSVYNGGEDTIYVDKADSLEIRYLDYNGNLITSEVVVAVTDDKKRASIRTYEYFIEQKQQDKLAEWNPVLKNDIIGDNSTAKWKVSSNTKTEAGDSKHSHVIELKAVPKEKPTYTVRLHSDDTDKTVLYQFAYTEGDREIAFDISGALYKFEGEDGEKVEIDPENTKNIKRQGYSVEWSIPYSEDEEDVALFVSFLPDNWYRWFFDFKYDSDQYDPESDLEPDSEALRRYDMAGQQAEDFIIDIYGKWTKLPVATIELYDSEAPDVLLKTITYTENDPLISFIKTGDIKQNEKSLLINDEEKAKFIKDKYSVYWSISPDLDNCINGQ